MGWIICLDQVLERPTGVLRCQRNESRNQDRFDCAFFQRQLELNPSTEPARKWRNVESRLFELVRHTGAGGFVRSRAEQHQRPFFGEHLYLLVEAIQRQSDRAGNGVRERVELHALSEIGYLHTITGDNFLVQIFGANPATTQPPHKQLPVDNLPGQPAQHQHADPNPGEGRYFSLTVQKRP